MKKTKSSRGAQAVSGRGDAVLRRKRLSGPARTLICAVLFAAAAHAGTGIEARRTDSKPGVRLSSAHSIDASRLKDGDRRKWERVVEVANRKDSQGRYISAALHEALERLDTDARRFVIVNESLERDTVGKYAITKFSGPGDFTEATIALDFERIRSVHSTTRGDFDASFRKYEGLFGSNGFTLRLAETFGHEANHAIFALENPKRAVELQHLLNARDADLRALPLKRRYPLPRSVLQEMEAADAALVETERFAQQAEKEIHAELVPGARRVHEARDRRAVVAAARPERAPYGDGR